MVVVRSSVRRHVIGGAHLLLVVTPLMVDVVVVQVDLPADSHSRVISHQAVLNLIHRRDCGLRDEHGGQRHAERGEKRPQSRGSQTWHLRTPDTRY